tara:strand:+ start:684 stop:1058 length:375 start_codon:yes stop_codon:yes gene_type:complete
MSTQLNEPQLLAAQYLAIGLRPSEVAEKLSIARETVSRWQSLPDFNTELQQANKDFIKGLIKREYFLLEMAQDSLETFLTNEEEPASKKAMVALRFMHQYASKMSLYYRLRNRHEDIIYNTDLL